MAGRPEKSITIPGIFNISIAMWRSKYGFSCMINNRKKNKDGQYENTPFFFLNDLIALRSCIDEAIGYATANPPPREDSAGGAAPNTNEEVATNSNDDVNW